MIGARTILLLRHAKSAWGNIGQDDHERPLNRRGERAARRMADHLVASGPRPDLVLCSTAARTRQTLAPLLQALGPSAPPVSLEKDLYLASEDTLQERLRALPEKIRTVLLIGHNDGIGSLAGALAGRGPAEALADLRGKYPTGALATLQLPRDRWSDLAPAACELVAFVKPRDFDRD